MANQKAFDMESFFAALADRTRLRLLNLMGDDEVCVCFFVEVIETNQPKISRHLAYLRKAGLVDVRRDGKWAHYKVVEPKDERARRVFNSVREWLKEDEDMRLDRQRLIKVCCAPQPPVSVLGAPRPRSIEAAA